MAFPLSIVNSLYEGTRKSSSDHSRDDRSISSTGNHPTRFFVAFIQRQLGILEAIRSGSRVMSGFYGRLLTLWFRSVCVFDSMESLILSRAISGLF
jgi:hypothetical protein